MKADELMIGDYVLFHHRPFLVKGLTLSGNVFVTGDLLDVKDDIEPIPLTIDTMEKNGFNEIDSYSDCYRSFYKEFNEGGEQYCLIRFYSDGLIMIHAGDDKRPSKEINKPINHIHELQHALKEVGIKTTTKI